MLRPAVSRAVVTVMLTAGLLAAAVPSRAAPGPSVTVTPDKGPARTEIHIKGAGYKSHQDVQIYVFSKYFRADETSYDGTFETTYDIPIDEYFGGVHSIWVDYADSGNRIGTTSFRLLPTLYTNAGAVSVGESVSSFASEFGSDEKVDVTLRRGAAVEEKLGIVTTQKQGFGKLDWKVPEVPGGKYELQAVGETSGLEAVDDLEIEPTITPTPGRAPPDDSVTIKGTGFQASQTVTLYLDDTGNGGPRKSLGDAVANSKGSFEPTFKLPHVPGGEASYIQASSPNVKEKHLDITAWVKAGPYEVNPPDALCQSTGQTQPSPIQLGITGAEYGPHSSVTLELVPKAGHLFQLGRASSIGNGDFSTTVSVPTAPFGKYIVAGLGKTYLGLDQEGYSNDVSIGFDACDNPSFNGSSVSDQWQGVGTDADSTVQVVYDGEIVDTTKADSDGSWTASDSFNCTAPDAEYGLTVTLGGKAYTFTNPLQC